MRLEDDFVVAHPAHHRPHEHAVEDKPEVLDGVVLGLGTDLGVGHPGLLELIEKELVPFVEGEAEPLIHLEEKSLAK
jgi:hypothetical protein